MNVLEKILEEIEDVRKIMKSTVATNCFGKECENDDCTVCVCERVIEIIRSHMNDETGTNVGSKSGWIPVEKRLPEINTRVLAIVKHSSWISDFNSDWAPEDKKIHYPETQNTYIAYVNENNEWIFMDEEGNENICDKEFGIDMERVYDVVTHWQPLPEPYKGEEAAG